MQRENEVQHVFLVGAKSLGAYGGVAVIIGTLKSSLFSSNRALNLSIGGAITAKGIMSAEPSLMGKLKLNTKV